jgi:hypothetical protein
MVDFRIITIIIVWKAMNAILTNHQIRTRRIVERLLLVLLGLVNESAQTRLGLEHLDAV